MKCIYCGIELGDDVKEEHVIHNALCGRLVSKEICCSKCNELLGYTVDAEFSSLFSKYLKRSYNLYKTNNASKWPGDNLSKEEIEMEYNEKVFNEGVAKIALEFAVYHHKELGEINLESLHKNFNIDCKDGEVKKIKFVSPVIPFFPLNRFDEYLELEAPFYLNHKLILFSHRKYLICYVELFSSFESYVLLSNHWQGADIYIPYVQEIRQFQSDPDLDCKCSSIKDLQIMLMDNYLWPNPEEKIKECIKNTKEEKIFNNMDLLDFLQDENIMKKVIDRSRKKEHYREVALESAIEGLVTNKYSETILNREKKDLKEFLYAVESICFYLNEDCLKPYIFRKFTPIFNDDCMNSRLYVSELAKILKEENNVKMLSEYRAKKQRRLIEYLENIEE